MANPPLKQYLLHKTLLTMYEKLASVSLFGLKRRRLNDARAFSLFVGNSHGARRKGGRKPFNERAKTIDDRASEGGAETLFVQS